MLLGWTAIALLLAAGRLGLLGASLSLAFRGVAVSIVSVAWLLSIDPRFTDSGFGAEIAVQQILFALAAIAALSPARAIALPKGDIAALLLASALGAFYLGLMTFIVKWYGDQPDDAAWYLARAHGLAFALLFGALLFGAAHHRLRVGAHPHERKSNETRRPPHDAWHFPSRPLAREPDDFRRARCARFPRRHGRLVAGRDDGGARRVTRWNSSSARMRRAVPFVILAGLGRLPRGFGVKRLMDLPMAWPDQWSALGLRAPVAP